MKMKPTFLAITSNIVYVNGFLVLPNNLASSTRNTQNHPFQPKNQSNLINGWSLSLSTPNDTGSKDDTIVPSFVESIVLKQVYPAMIKHKEEFGNPNIPLGSTDGKKCKVLRQLAFQKKLNEEEMNLLKEMDFRLNSLEDVYEDADFDECLERLLDYEKEHKSNYQIPKKYKPDPELGAWVTMIRRIGRDNIAPDRRKKLDSVNFVWVSTRKCGSAFMSNFRPLKERLEKCCEINDDGTTQVIDKEGLEQILIEDDVKKWIKAQNVAAQLGNLGEARCNYMDQLPGFNWRDI